MASKALQVRENEEVLPLPEASIPTMLSAYRQRWRDRDVRMKDIDDVVGGDFNVFDPDEKIIENRSVNMIQVGIEDTAEAAALLPTVRVTPHKPTQGVRKSAQRMERMAVNYLEMSNHEVLINRSLLDGAAFGFWAWTVLPYFDDKIVRIEKRDPRHVYPEPGWKPGEDTRRVVMARNVYVSQLPAQWRALLSETMSKTMANNVLGPAADPNLSVTLVEYFDDQRYTIYGLYQNVNGNVAPYAYSPTNARSTPANARPVLFDHWSHNLGFCPVVVEQRVTLDGEPRGQFDQAIGMQKAHVELWGMIMDYADQAVYSDLWVRDLIGDMPLGGGGYIELGPNGAVGRVPPAVTSLNAIDNLARLEDAIHLGGRWPASRPGQIDQSIASGKFLEASAGMMNTAIRTYHMLLARAFGKALRMCFAADKKYFPGKKTMAGTLRSQEFTEEYDTADIDLANRIKVDYGIGFGREPSQSAVLAIQYNQLGLVSDETVQENIDGLNDIANERSRVDVQAFRDMAMARLVQGLQDKTIPESALLEIAQARRNHEDIFDLYKKFVVEPAEEMQQQMLTGGLGQVPIGPAGGMPALPSGAAGPGTGEPGIAPPDPPLPAEMLSRINTPAGPGGVLGTQVQG